jgi:hypothetical protein
MPIESELPFVAFVLCFKLHKIIHHRGSPLSASVSVLSAAWCTLRGISPSLVRSV